MKSPAINTLLLITAGRCCRVDVEGGMWSTARRAGLPLAEAARTALTLGGPAGRSAIVLTTDAWTQTLSLHRGQVSGLSKIELQQALAFEAEPFSGLPALESVTAATDSGARDGSASFWIVQLARGERDAVQRIIKESGSRLLGIGHPGGAPAPLSSMAGGTAWHRVECWDGAWLLLLCADGRQVQTKVVPSVPEGRDLPAHGTLEKLHGREGTPFDAAALSLADEATLRSYGGRLLQHADGLPLIAAEAPPPARSLPWVAGVALTSAALVLGLAQFVWFGKQKSDLRALQAEHAVVQPSIDNAKKEAAKLRTDIAAAEKKRQSLARVARQRGALALLLEELAKHCPRDVVVSGVKPDRGGMILHGVALDAASVDELGIVLTTALKPAGLFAQAQEKKARLALANQGPWDFSLAVLPVELANKPVAPVNALSDN